MLRRQRHVSHQYNSSSSLRMMVFHSSILLSSFASSSVFAKRKTLPASSTPNTHHQQQASPKPFNDINNKKQLVNRFSQSQQFVEDPDLLENHHEDDGDDDFDSTILVNNKSRNNGTSSKQQDTIVTNMNDDEEFGMIFDSSNKYHDVAFDGTQENENNNTRSSKSASENDRKPKLVGKIRSRLNAPSNTQTASGRIFDSRRQSAYFDDLLVHEESNQQQQTQKKEISSSSFTAKTKTSLSSIPLAKMMEDLKREREKKMKIQQQLQQQNISGTGASSSPSSSSLSPTGELSAEKSSKTTTKRKKITNLRSIDESAQIYSGRNAFFENPEQSSKLLAKVIEQKRREILKERQRELEEQEKNEKQKLADEEEKEKEEVLQKDSSTKEAIEEKVPTKDHQQQQEEIEKEEDLLPTPTDPTVKAVFDTLKEELSKAKDSNKKSQQQHYIRVHDLKQAIKKKKLLSEDGGPLPSKVSILRFLKQHTDKYFDVTGNGMYVSTFGTFSLADKVQPDYSPTFDSFSSSPANTFNKKKKSIVGEQDEDDEFSNLNLDDEEGDDNEWDVELDLDMDEQAETNRVVQESFELEQLEELEEQGKLDKLLKSNFSAVLGDSSSAAKNKKKKKSSKLYSERKAAEIFKLFANEVAAIPAAPDLNPSALISAQDLIMSSASGGANRNSLLSISEILRLQQQESSFQNQQQQSPSTSNSSHHQGLGGSYSSSSPITKMAAPPPPLPGMASKSTRATPPPLHSVMMSSSGVRTGWGASQQNLSASGSSTSSTTPPTTSSSSVFADASSILSPQTQELLTLFVECIPTFFVPVMLLRVSDSLRRVTGNRDIGRVVRQYHFFFDFKQQDSSPGTTGTAGIASSRNLLVKMKTGLRHPKIGEADKLYGWALPSSSSSATTKNANSPDENTKASSSSSPVAPETIELLKKQKQQDIAPEITEINPRLSRKTENNNSTSGDSDLNSSTPRIAPIRLATDQIDDECLQVMSALNKIEEKREKDAQQEQEKRRPFSASCEELFEVLSLSDNKESGTIFAGIKSPNELFKWILQRPRMFSVFLSPAATTETKNTEFLISLRPLDVAPGSLYDFDLQNNSSSTDTTKIQEEIFNKFSTASQQQQTLTKTADAILEIYGKMRAGMWMDVNSLKRKLKTQKFLHVDDASTEELFCPSPDVFSSPDSCDGDEKIKLLQESYLLTNKNTNDKKQVGIPTKTTNDDKIKNHTNNNRLQWFRFFGKSVWVDNVQLTPNKSSTVTTRFRKFTGSTDLDDVEHFALNLLHAQIKQMANDHTKSKKKVNENDKSSSTAIKTDFQLKGEILKELPACVAFLFSSNLEVTFRVLKAQPNKFVVVKKKNSKTSAGSDENENKNDDLIVGYASLFRKG